MFRKLTRFIPILFAWIIFSTNMTWADDHDPRTRDHQNRANGLPRKVIIGTTMTRWYSDYPGLDGRLKQMQGLLEEMSADSMTKYGRSMDLALFSEYALTAGKSGSAKDVAIKFDESIRTKLAAMAQKHRCYIAFGGVFVDDRAPDRFVNAAIVLDRKGEIVGRYVKAHPVFDRVSADGRIILEGGVHPGSHYEVFDLDFGKVGIQICYDVNFPEGWQRLADKGAEIVLFPSQSPQYTRPGSYAANHEYWVVSSTFRNNASFFEPGTGLVAAKITEPKQTLVHEIDLSYTILPWSSKLKNGELFREKFGNRAGYRYSESEDRGIFWSNDPMMSIGDMTKSLGLVDLYNDEKVALQKIDQARGGPAK